MTTPYCCEGCGKTSRIAPHLPGCTVAAAWDAQRAADARDLGKLTDREIRDEHERKQRAAREAAQQVAVRQAQLDRDMQAGKDAEFAAKFGLTYQQFLEIEDYLSDKFHDDWGL